MDGTTYRKKTELKEHLAVHSAASLRTWGFDRVKLTSLPDPGEEEEEGGPKTRSQEAQTNITSFRGDVQFRMEALMARDARDKVETIGKGTAWRAEQAEMFRSIQL